MRNDDLAGAAESDRTDAAATSDADAGTGTSADTDTGTGTGTGIDTPIFHATVEALAATFATDATAESALGDAAAVEHIDTEPDTDAGTTTPGTVPRAGTSDDTGDVQDTGEVQNVDDTRSEDWVDQRYGDPSSPTPVIDPDTPEGAAILSLFRRMKDIEEPKGKWPSGDVVTALTDWFTELGIDPDQHPMDAGSRLRLALRERPGGLASSVYGVRISTDHDDPEAVIRIALHVLARQLGHGTSIKLVSHDRELLTRIEHHSGPSSVPTAGS